jgi:hypothetical protein
MFYSSLLPSYQNKDKNCRYDSYEIDTAGDVPRKTNRFSRLEDVRSNSDVKRIKQIRKTQAEAHHLLEMLCCIASHDKSLHSECG